MFSACHIPVSGYIFAISRGAILLVCAALAACNTMPAGQDVATSWDKAKVYVPGLPDNVSPDRVATNGKKFPVVVYMHGCSGITSHNDIPWAVFMKDLGYLVVQPDSLARRDRGISCEGYRHVSPGVHRLRLQEVEYALEKLQTVAWADSKNVFLMGHSEGGVATARTSIRGFSGAIISGWTCTEPRYPSYDGIFLPNDTPVLSMGWNLDPWYAGGPYAGSCGNKMAGRKSARHLEFSGQEHSTVQVPEARQAVTEFLRANLK